MKYKIFSQAWCKQIRHFISCRYSCFFPVVTLIITVELLLIKVILLFVNMILGVFASLATIVKLNLTKPQIDNHVFRLYHKWSTFLCFVACGLVAASDFIGGAIECLGGDSFVNTACWLSSTYTLNTTRGMYLFIFYHIYS